MQTRIVKTIIALGVMALFLGGLVSWSVAAKHHDISSPKLTQSSDEEIRTNLRTMVSILSRIGDKDLQGLSRAKRAQALKPLGKFILQEVILLREAGMVSQSTYSQFENRFLSLLDGFEKGKIFSRTFERKMDEMLASLNVEPGKSIPVMFWPPANCHKCLDINFADHYRKIVNSSGNDLNVVLVLLAEELAQTTTSINDADVGIITSQNRPNQAKGRNVLLSPGHRDYVKN